MDSNLYDKETVCPVCSKKFMVTKVKAKGCKVVSRESDFCVRYEDINPIVYDVWVCEHCGYAAQSERFESISDKDIKLVRQHISPKWTKRSFNGERNLDIAVEAFKLALLNAHVRNARPNELARLCLRIAWMYRFKGEEDKEKEFLKHALRSYTETYEKERFPVEKMDEYTCLYMVAELNRRVGNLEESSRWFGRLITNPDAARMNRTIMETAREQYSLVKDQLKETTPGGEA